MLQYLHLFSVMEAFKVVLTMRMASPWVICVFHALRSTHVKRLATWSGALHRLSAIKTITPSTCSDCLGVHSKR